MTSTGPSSATLQQIKEAPVGTQSLGEQRLSAFEGDLEKAFRPLVRGWQPGQAPLTQEQYDKIQRASIDLFDKLGYLNPIGSQPSRVAAASMRKGTRPPPRTYAEAKTPQATEVEFQHASPHKFTNVDVENPLGRFDEAHLLKGEGATVYGPGAAYVSTAEPTHRHYMKQFAERNSMQDVIEATLGRQPGVTIGYLNLSNPTAIQASLPYAEQQLLKKQKSLEAAISRAEYRKALDNLNMSETDRAARIAAWDKDIAGSRQALAALKPDFEYLEKLKNFDYSKVPTPEGPYSYRGSLAEDPARTVLFDKSLAEQTPEVQAALARASSSVRRALGKTNSPMPPKLFNLTPEQEKAFIEYANIRGDRSDTAWDRTMNLARTNPKVLLQDPKLTPEARDAVEALIAQQTTNVRQNRGAAGEYIKDYRASPKTVQRLRDAGIDLIKYQGSSQSPNYVVLNPAAAKIRTRTPSIAATFGTGELARQLYESIYGKGAQ